MGLVVDNFAGGGGASTGIEAALGRPVDIAVNHDAAAIEMHRANHPQTRHLCEDVFDVSPREVCGGRPVDVAWFSPDCKHFSRAKGGKPVDRKIRGLAWVAVRWAREVKPHVIFLENVPEFLTWGPLDDAGRPVKERVGEEFGRWKAALEALGYRVEYRMLVAADYGAPTIRKRLYLIARADDLPIEWPSASHRNPKLESDVFDGGRPAWRTAAECIDWSLPCPSIFGRKRALKERTISRIAKGLQRFALGASLPFVVQLFSVAEEVFLPFLTEHANASNQRNIAVDEPLRTQCAQVKGGHFAVVAARCSRVASAECAPLLGSFLVKYYGNEKGGCSLDTPMPTVTVRDRLGLVNVFGESYRIVDIGMRMLTPRELARAQGFPDSYVLTGSRTNQVARIGNSVCPPVAEALVRANCMWAIDQEATA